MSWMFTTAVIHLSGKFLDSSSTCSVSLSILGTPASFLSVQTFTRMCLFVFYTAFTMEQDIPDYDMDSEDEKWIHTQGKKLDINPLQVKR